MSLLSKAEIQYLQSQKQISKSYEYKIKSIIKKKLANLVDKELPLLSSLLLNSHDLTKFSKMGDKDDISSNLTDFSKAHQRNTNISNLPKIARRSNHVRTLYDNPNHSKVLYPCKSPSNHKLYIENIKNEDKDITRAGGLAWLRYRLDMAGVVGSNPTRPICKFLKI